YHETVAAFLDQLGQSKSAHTDTRQTAGHRFKYDKALRFHRRSGEKKIVVRINIRQRLSRDKAVKRNVVQQAEMARLDLHRRQRRTIAIYIERDTWKALFQQSQRPQNNFYVLFE